MSSASVNLDQHSGKRLKPGSPLQSLSIFLSVFLAQFIGFSGLILAQVEPDHPEGDPFGLPFTDSTIDEDPIYIAPSSISISRTGKIKIIGPDQVPNLQVIGTLRIGIDDATGQDDRSSKVHFRKSDIRIEGSALESNHFRFRANLDGVRSPGVFSEAWIDREVRNGIHLTGGRIPNSLGLQGGLPPEDRITISHGLLDWIDEGSSWALRAGGRWLDDSVTVDLQTRLGGAADLRGDYFGGQGVSGRLSLKPFAPLLFGGPTADDSPDKHFSVFLSGRWDHDVDGQFQMESGGESLIFQSKNLQMDSTRWVRAGWRWPILDWLHLENEWSRTGFFGVESTGTKFDSPGEIDGWQLGVRLLPFSSHSLATRSGPDLPPSFFDELSPFDHSDIEMLIRYEKVDLGDQLARQDLLNLGADAGTVQVLRFGISSRPTAWCRWLLEGTRTVTEGSISAFDGDEANSIRILIEIGG